jgi:Alr-MurF fusion protein
VNTPLESTWIREGTWWPAPPEQTRFARVATDSRRLFQPGQTLFFCLRGPRHDGHRFIEEAWRQGVRAFVTDHRPPQALPDTCYLIVPDTLAALQTLAGAWRATLRAPLTAITGSNGKTMVKEWLYTLLREDYRIARSPRSYNSQVGTALSLLMAGPEHELIFIEAGISQPGEMDRLQKMIRPDIGILTSLGSAHDEGFPDRGSKLREKLLLFREVRALLVPADLVRTWPDAFAGLDGRLLTWSEQGPADLMMEQLEESPQGQTIYYRFREIQGFYHLPHAGAIARRNSLTCLLYALYLGADPRRIGEGMTHLPALTMRLETREGWQGNLVISDHYNADPDALGLALSFYAQRKGPLAGWIILSDLEESGLSAREQARLLSELLQCVPVDRITHIGQAGSELARQYRGEARVDHYPDVRSLLEAGILDETRHTAFLLKGARRFAFEAISRKLVRLSHNTVLEVNLGALSHNLLAYTRRLGPDTRTLVMVKASAYGGGSAEIARWLALQRVHYLGVAYADEGVELRRAGIGLPVLVLNVDETAFPLLVSHSLEPEIHSLTQLRALLHFLSPSDPVIPIHLKLETGMHRLGLEAGDLSELLRLIRDYGQVRVASVLSHLSASEDSRHDAFTREQARRFSELAGVIDEGLGYRPLRHLLNSSGILRFPEYHLDMVRIGIGLYGFDPAADPNLALRPALALRSRISRIHEVPAGESVGYGRRGIAEAARRIATVAIGYADGLLRLSGEGRYALRIRGREAPIVGAVCMDMTMVDVSAIPEAAVDDPVTVFDEDKPVSGLAAALHTIPYEVLTNIAPRVPRIYIEE